MNPRKENPQSLSTLLRLEAQRTTSLSPVAGIFLLTVPFIGRAYRTSSVDPRFLMSDKPTSGARIGVRPEPQSCRFAPPGFRKGSRPVKNASWPLTDHRSSCFNEYFSRTETGKRNASISERLRSEGRAPRAESKTQYRAEGERNGDIGSWFALA
jgi:hypothetical protein